jgi:two-component system nitrogen regulation sensor histidine kinase GlnL
MTSDTLQQQLLDSLSTAILLLDDRLKVQYLNVAAEMLLEVSGRRGQGLEIGMLMTESQSIPVGVEKAVARGSPYTQRQTPIELPGGDTITVDYTVTPIVDNDKQLLVVEIQPLDRLLRISREETILSAQESSRTLIRGLAHEIKNPLGGLRGAAQLLARELPNDELRDYTTIIIDEADRLRNLVDRLLGPHSLPQTEDVNIHEVLERVIQLVGAETGGSISFVKDYDPSIPALKGDPERLIQAVLNIVRNAMQAMQTMPPEQPEIIFTTRILRQFTLGKHRHRLVCHIDIADNGPGVPEEILHQIFFPMVSGRAEGTGLGLSIAQSIINQHQGLIECNSHPGDTHFSLYLPLEPIHD